MVHYLSGTGTATEIQSSVPSVRVMWPLPYCRCGAVCQSFTQPGGKRLNSFP